jgi:hypothetical protein
MFGDNLKIIGKPIKKTKLENLVCENLDFIREGKFGNVSTHCWNDICEAVR